MKIKRCVVFVCLVVCAFTLAIQAGKDIRLYDGWKFYRGDQTGAQQTSFNDASWTGVTLPHTPRVEALSTPCYLGVCWYRKTFTPDASWTGKKVFIEFEAAMQTADVYINGTKALTHLGGYKPFVLDISSSVSGPIVIAARLDNNSDPAFGPGKVAPDFEYFGGLYRDVNIYVTDLLHITNPIFENIPGGGGVFVSYSNVSSASATVTIKTHVRNEYSASKSCALKTIIQTIAGQEVISASATQSIAAKADYTFNQTLTVTNPKLWDPDAPNLYVVRSEVSDGSTIVDTQKTTIGIRTLSFTRSGFSINGKHIIFRGANRHQDYPYIGNAVPRSGQYRDALRLKEGGFNFVRMSHYTQSIAFVEACDRVGVMSMACIPGWHSPEMTTNSLLDVRNMVRYYRNHPSVILWEVVHNESNDGVTLTAAAKTATTEEYGSQCFTVGENTKSGIDVYSPTAQSAGRTEGASESRPTMLSEYGDYEYGGSKSTSRGTRGDGEAKMLVSASNRYHALDTNRSLTWMCGDAVWSMFDYSSGSSGTIQLTGVADIFRLPKFSYYFYQSQRDPGVVIPNVNSGPMVYIASWAASSSSKTVKVFSNCEKVALSVNGSAVATQSPDGGTHLEHAPFTFTVSSMGTLKAEGIIGGVVKATHTVNPPGSASKMVVVIDTANRKFLADGSDIALVYASIVDANGTVVPSSSASVTFSVTSGPGTIVGSTSMNADAGIASALVQSQTSAGTITIQALSGSLTAGKATVKSWLPMFPDSVNGSTGVNVYMRAMSTPPKTEIMQTGNKLVVKATGSTNRTFTLCNTQGRQVVRRVLAKRETVINLTPLPYGMYIGRLSGSEQDIPFKVLRNCQ